MPTGKDIKRTSSQVMELKDLISGPLAATIDADSIATRRYLSYLMELAFESYDKETGKVGELRMLEFNYQSHDVDGTHHFIGKDTIADISTAAIASSKRS